MPANKRRSRNGNTSTTTLKPTNSICNFSNNLNGIVNGNGYHHSNNSDHQIKAQGSLPILNGGLNITAKQQQQLDRNAFLLTLTKDQLKIECRKRGQKTTGTKTELVESLFLFYLNLIFHFFCCFESS